MVDEDFYEDDEPIDVIRTSQGRGRRVVTERPVHVGRPSVAALALTIVVAVLFGVALGAALALSR